MQTLFYPAFDTLEIRDLPEPMAAADEVVMEVAACGICGSELETFKTHSPRRQPPLVMGHEFCGVVTAVGAEVEGVKVGERYVANAVVPCGICRSCRRGETHLCPDRQVFGMHRPGAFAGQVNVPARVLIPWPAQLPATQACLAEPLANGIHMVHLTAHLAAEVVLIIGAGPIGLLTLLAFRHLRGSAVWVTDLSRERLAVAERLGAAKVLHREDGDPLAALREATGGEGVPLVIDAAGSGGTKQFSLDALRPGGATVWIGLHENAMRLETYQITLPEKQVLGTYSAKQSELAEAVELLANGGLDVESWVTISDLAGSAALFERMLRPGPEDFKGIVLPNGAGV